MPPTVHILALASAVLSAAATIFIRQGLRGGTAYAGFWLNVAVGAVGLWTAVLLTGGIGRTSTSGIVFFVLAGIIGTVAGRLLRFMLSARQQRVEEVGVGGFLRGGVLEERLQALAALEELCCPGGVSKRTVARSAACSTARRGRTKRFTVS